MRKLTWAIISLLLSFYISALYAEVSVKSLEINDKVSDKAILVQSIAKSNADGQNTMALHAEQWDLVHDGESILALPVINQLVNKWLVDKHNKIQIQYPGGEEGLFWVQSLTDWLVSLGIPSSSLVIVPGSGADDLITFAIIK